MHPTGRTLLAWIEFLWTLLIYIKEILVRSLNLDHLHGVALDDQIRELLDVFMCPRVVQDPTKLAFIHTTTFHGLLTQLGVIYVR